MPRAKKVLAQKVLIMTIYDHRLLVDHMTGLKGAARTSCPLCCSAFAPNMLDSISEMKKQQTAVRLPQVLCLTETPATLPRLLKASA